MEIKKKIKKIVVTGGAGFMGSHFLRIMMSDPAYFNTQFINIDKLTYAGNPNNVIDLAKDPRYVFIKADICDLKKMTEVLKEVDAVIHFAAESHVDNSVRGALDFSLTNGYGTHVMLEAARRNKVPEFIHISTDEVYGEIEEGASVESDEMHPTNPYSASKAAAEMTVKGYRKTYRMPVKMVRGSNNVGPFQYPEKLVPRFTTHLIRGEKVPLHGDGSNKRTWIYVEDFARAVKTVLEKGEPGQTYNIGTPFVASNLDITRMILSHFGKDDSAIEFIKDRPFNDSRYHVDSSKLRALGWTHQVSLEEAIKRTVEWFQKNRSWWEKIDVREKGVY